VEMYAGAVLYAVDIARVVAFYEGVAGLTVTAGNPVQLRQP
jgi:hypothetical protein